MPADPVRVRALGLVVRGGRLTRPALALVVSVAALLFVTALLGPAVASIAKARARSRGVEMEIAHASLGWGSVRLTGVTVRIPELHGVDVALGRMVLYPSFAFGLARIEVQGGTIRAEGTYEALRGDFDTFRRAHAPTGAGGAPRGDTATPAIVFHGVDLAWRRGAGTGDEGRAWGIRYERAKDGTETLGADLARLSLAGATVEVSHGRVELRRNGDARVLAGSVAEHLTVALDVDTLIGGGAGPASEVSPGGGSPPLAPVATDASDAGRGPRLRERIRQTTASFAALLPPSGKVDLPAARFEVRHAGEMLNFGPAATNVSRENETMKVAVTSGAGEGRTPLALRVEAPLGAGVLEVALSGGPLPLAALGLREGDMGLQDLDRAEVEVNGSARLSEDGRSLSISGQSRISDLSVADPRLAAEPVRGLRLGVGGQLDIALDGSHAGSSGLEVALGRVKMLAAAPPALVRRLAGLEASGTFALVGDVAFDTRRPGDVKVDFTAANACRLTQVPADLSPEKFRRPWTRTVLGADRAPVEIQSGPGTPGWVPLFDVSPHVATSVVVCEDAHFYTHDGFDGKSIEDSIRDDLRAGKFVRGGSTVSMQLAKNLYLGREKTLSRKLEEAVLTLLLEQTLGKAGILELYLNVVEFGPGIYGIGPAASHYFHTTPKELSLAQSLYLISLLPSPKVNHFASDGTLRPHWAEYLRHLMSIAHKIHRVTDAELAAGLAENVHFGVPSAGGSPGAPGEDSGDGEGSANRDVLEMAPHDDPGDGRGP